MIHRTLPHIRVSRSPRYAALHPARHCPGGAGPDAGRTPAQIAACLFCARSRVYRIVRAYRTGTLGVTFDKDGQWRPPIRTTVLLPTLRRSLLALLKTVPQTYGGCRTRWSCATLALTLQATRGLTVSAETLRRWLHFEPLKACEAMLFADELDIPRLPKVGAAWMPKGTQLAVMTPGTNAKYYLAGALDVATGGLLHCCGPRKTHARFRDLLQRSEGHYPTAQYTRRAVVVANYQLHTAKAGQHWWLDHPRVTLLCLPAYCPRATPIERAFGDVHDCCTRNHRRQRVSDLVAEVEAHLHVNGPWLYKLSQLDDEPASTTAVEKIAAAEHAQVAA